MTEIRLGRGERAKATLRLPGRRRVVTLRFLDQAGQPVPYLSSPPRFAALHAVGIAGRPRPGRILREPPHHPRGEAIYESEVSYSGSRKRITRRRFATDQGRYSVEVVAGARGRIFVPMRAGVFDNGAVSITSSFEGAEWSDKVIRVKLRPAYAERMARLEDGNSGDPGARSLLTRPAPAATPPVPPARDPFDAPDLRNDQFRLVASGPADAHPVLLTGKRRRSMTSHGNGLWSMNLSAGRYEIAASDGALFHPPAQEFIGEGGRVVRIDLEAGRRSATLAVRGSPTLNAWSAETTFALSPDRDSVTGRTVYPSRTRPAERSGDQYVYASALSAAWREGIAESATLHVAFQPHTRGALGYRDDGRITKPFDAHVDTLVLTDDERGRLLAGRLELDLTSRRRQADPPLLFRVLGDRGEGLPWVEGSIIPAEKDALAQAIRTATRNLVQESLPRPRDLQKPADGEEIMEEIEIEEEVMEEWGGSGNFDAIQPVKAIPSRPSRETLRKRYGGPTIDAFDDEALDRLWRQGAWYDSHRRVASDRQGYVYKRGLRLTPGRLYVLYLWAASRNDLEPDRRLVFRATGGFTDLGIIQLPSR